MAGERQTRCDSRLVFQRFKTWKVSDDPDFEPKPNRIRPFLAFREYAQDSSGDVPTVA